MAEPGRVQYRRECLACGKQFLLESIDAKIPKHLPRGKAHVPGTPDNPCVGSNTIGRYLGVEQKCD